MFFRKCVIVFPILVKADDIVDTEVAGDRQMQPAVPTVTPTLCR